MAGLVGGQGGSQFGRELCQFGVIAVVFCSTQLAALLVGYEAGAETVLLAILRRNIGIGTQGAAQPTAERRGIGQAGLAADELQRQGFGQDIGQLLGAAAKHDVAT